MYYLLAGVIAVAILYLVGRKKGITFSSAEAALVAKLKLEEQKALGVYILGKEDVFAEYERLKSRVESLTSLGKKLPSPPVVVTNVVAPAQPAIVVAPITTAAVAQPSVVALAPIVAPVSDVPPAT